MADYVLAIDQGTTSSRAIIFNHSGTIVETGQLEHEQIFPR
ncbi:MAG TPA: FGGY family carbohydrate kinase, partial [Cellulomonadaceae bacterium]|nr:FGGY family carbohydrate kinase [Cellulomonadaceae bacterium]